MKESITKAILPSARRVLSLLLVLALLCTVLPRVSPLARAEDDPVYSGACGDNLTWSFNPETGLLAIEGSGRMEDYYQSSAPWQSYCQQITALSLPDGLTGIGRSAFRGCTGLTSLSFPEGLTSIGDYAFQGCTGLTSLSFPEGLTSIGWYAFQGCTGLTSLSFPEGLTSIGWYAFQGCTGLTTLSFPEGLTDIGDSAFYGCTGLTSLSFPEGLTYIGGSAFSGCTGLTTLSFPEGLTIIFNGAFYGCTGLTSLSFPEGLTYIGDSAFQGCTGLTSLSFPERLTSIRSDAFSGCTGLTSLSFPEGLTSISDSAFRSCTGLTSLSFPEGLTSIGISAFRDCTGLTSLSFPEGLTSIGNYAFCGCTGLTSLSFPEGLTSIGDSAFYGCTGLTSLSFPEGLSSIGSSAFYGCNNLTVVEIKSFGCSIYANSNTLGVPGTTTIYGYAESTAQTYAEQYGYSFVSLGGFELSGECGANGDNLLWTLNTETGLLTITGAGEMKNYSSYSALAPWYSYCTAVSTVDFPEGLTSIGNWAFYGCKGLTSLSFPEGLTSIGNAAFRGCTGLTSLSFPEGLTNISWYAFQGCTGLTSLSFPEGLTSIGNAAFRGCTGLQSVTMPRSLAVLGYNAYQDCTALSTVIVRNPDCLVEEQRTYNDSSAEDLKPTSDSLGVPESTVVYGRHSPEKENADREVYHEWGYTVYCRYAENYAKVYGYTFYPTNAFSDVTEGQWYEIPVAWAVGKGITAGTGEGIFSPNLECTREQVATFLWAAYGRESPSGQSSPFRDVKPGDWFYTPVLWASERGISSGTGNGYFGVGTNCSRAQVVTFLWAAAGKPEPETQTNPFTDVAEDAYYRKAVLWAVEKGITGGTGAGRFSPDMVCTRAQVVTFLYAALEKNK